MSDSKSSREQAGEVSEDSARPSGAKTASNREDTPPPAVPCEACDQYYASDFGQIDEDLAGRRVEDPKDKFHHSLNAALSKQVGELRAYVLGLERLALKACDALDMNSPYSNVRIELRYFVNDRRALAKSPGGG